MLSVARASPRLLNSRRDLVPPTCNVYGAVTGSAIFSKATVSILRTSLAVELPSTAKDLNLVYTNVMLVPSDVALWHASFDRRAVSTTALPLATYLGGEFRDRLVFLCRWWFRYIRS